MKKMFLPAAAAVFGILLAGCCVWCTPQPTAAKFAVRNVYGSNMVLQQQKPIKIVGTAEPGKSVKVAIGKNSVIAAADKDGNWVAVLPEMEASFTPYTVTVSGAEGSKPVVFNNVLIGEVWFCSGQSNMQMPVVGGKFWCSKNGRAEAAAANFPNIRIFQVNRTRSPGKELDHITSQTGWEVCTPKTIGKFSACGFYFGRKLHQDLNVPVGLINSSWGGTRIEPWISKAGFMSRDLQHDLTPILAAESADYQKTIAELEKDLSKKTMEWYKTFLTHKADKTAVAADWKNPGIDCSSWQKATLPNFTFGYIGVIWFRRDIEIPQDMAGKDLLLYPGVIDDLDDTFFNGEKVGSTDISEEGYWRKVRCYKVPGKLVKAGKNTIAIRAINVAHTGQITENMQIKCGNKSIDISGSWLKKREFVADLTKIGPRPTVNSCDLTSPQFPATLYNAMVKAWTVYPMRGFIWYQGCSNGGEPERYMTLHPLLIEDWRNKWNDHSMPFIFAQLAAFHKHSPKKPVTMEYLKSLAPNDRGFSRLREVQTATLKVPGTGMGVAIDIGDPSDIHPADKQTLSYRMAMEAKRLAYGYKGVTSGPMYKSMKIDGNKIIVSFTGTGSGLQVKGDKINCFAVAGKNGKFVWANAKLLNDNTVEVWADSIKAPVAVRYAWAPYPVDPNLYNKEGFPACPFRSDAPGYLLK